jgi:hypothetical protein
MLGAPEVKAGQVAAQAVKQCVVRITRADGSVIDISPARVKEYVPNMHPNAPEGALNQVKFPDALSGSKGYKRAPTLEELNYLRSLK